MPYNFTAEDFNKFTEDILSADGDRATLTTLLADMSSTVSDALAKDVANTQKLETTEAENKRLKEANMELFLRKGQILLAAEEAKPEEEKKPISTKDYMAKYFESLEDKK